MNIHVVDRSFFVPEEFDCFRVFVFWEHQFFWNITSIRYKNIFWSFIMAAIIAQLTRAKESIECFFLELLYFQLNNLTNSFKFIIEGTGQQSNVWDQQVSVPSSTIWWPFWPIGPQQVSGKVSDTSHQICVKIIVDISDVNRSDCTI